MREGMQIEDANITVDDKIELLDMLSETGLTSIVVGSFVSPKWTPQMERIDEIVQRFTPKAGVTYSALALNSRGVERARAYSPPLTIERDKYPRLELPPMRRVRAPQHQPQPDAGDGALARNHRPGSGGGD